MTYGKIFAMCAAMTVTAGGLFAMTPPASAAESTLVVTAPDEALPTRRVSYADLNLASRVGEKTLHRRVGKAVTSVCDEAVGPSANYYVEMSCRSFAWNGARPQMNLAVKRAQEISLNGISLIAVTAIHIAAPQ